MSSLAPCVNLKSHSPRARITSTRFSLLRSGIRLAPRFAPLPISLPPRRSVDSGDCFGIFLYSFGLAYPRQVFGSIFLLKISESEDRASALNRLDYSALIVTDQYETTGSRKRLHKTFQQR